MRKLIGPMLVAALTFSLSAGTAFAHLDQSESRMDGGPLVVPVSSLNGGADASVHAGSDDTHGDVRASGKFGLDRMKPEPERGNATSTAAHERNDLRKFMKDMLLLKHGVPGVVSSVSSNSFLMTVPAGKDHATTTVTVNVSSSTKFTHGSTTAALTDLSAGTRVEVLGTVSTSTQTISADRVIIGQKGMGMPEAKKKLFDRIKDFFTGKHASTTKAMIDARGEAAVSADGHAGFLNGFLHKLFGWL